MEHPGPRLGESPLLRRSGPHRDSGRFSGSIINFGVTFVLLSSRRNSFSIRLVPGSCSTGPHCCLFWFLSCSSTQSGFTNEDDPNVSWYPGSDSLQQGCFVPGPLLVLFLGHRWSCSWASTGPVPGPRGAALTRVPDPGQDLVQLHLTWTA